MQGSISQLGDSMNFPESNRVAKREPLSNLIFKITQSTEKVNRRNERLLKLNLDYELRMLRLARQKEQKIFKRLDSERRCSLKTNEWLLGIPNVTGCFLDDGTEHCGCHCSQKQKKRESEHLSLPRLVERQPRTNEKDLLYKANYRIERTFTAPELKHANGNDFNAARFSRNIRSAETKRPVGLQPGKIGVITMPDIIPVDQADTRAIGDDYNDATMILKIKTGEIETIDAPLPQGHDEARNMEDRANGISNEMTSDASMGFSQLLQKAKESTDKQAAYIPVDTSYRRSCTTRKKYQDAEGKRPRILNRYLKEKREFETLFRDR